MANKKSLWVTFWPIWTLANGLGWSAFSIVYILPILGFGIAIGIGFFISLCQWAVLEEYIGIDIMWLWLSSATYGIFLFTVMFFISDISLIPLLWVEVICLSVLGFLQRTSLNHAVDRGLVWVFVSPFAAVAGTIISSLLAHLIRNNSPVFFWAGLGIVYGLTTGVTIILLKKYTAKSSLSTINQNET
ncbi:MAG TPA: hypothetical protein VHM28_02785 [Anaerolineales bacterium]|jgi:hypothetical protein|nr:hypothetical protein [Anaerolineales bacterium]